MKVREKNDNRVVIEVLTSEIEKKDFYFIWDQIRDTYDSKKYSLESIKGFKNFIVVTLNIVKI